LRPPTRACSHRRMARSPLVAQAIRSAPNMLKRIKVTEALVAAARKSPSSVAEVITAFLEESHAKTSRVPEEHRASRQRIAKMLSGGYNMMNIGLGEYLVSIGVILTGPKEAYETEEIARVEAAGDAVAKAFAAASQSWSDDMLWVFLQACVVRRA